MLAQLASAFREVYSGIPAAAWMLSGVLLINRCGAMVLPFLSIYLTRQRGMPASLVGQLLAVYGVGAVLGSWLGGWASGRVGPIRVQLASLVLTAAGFLLVLAAQTPPALVLSLLFLSISSDMLRPASALATAHFCPPQSQAKGLALNRLAVNLGLSVGPVVGGLLAEYDFRWLFWVDAATCLLAAAALAAWFGSRYDHEMMDSRNRRQKGRPSQELEATSANPLDLEPAQVGGPWGDPRFLFFLAMILLSGLTFFQLTGAYPLYLVDHYGLDTAAIGRVFTINTLLIVSVEMFIIHRWGQRRVLRLAAWGAALVGLGFGMLPWGATWGYVAVSVVVWTVGEMFLLSPATSYVIQHAPLARRGAYMGLFTSSVAVANVVGSLVGMRIYEFNPTWLWSCAGGVCLAAAAGLLWLDWDARRGAAKDPQVRTP